MRTMCCIALAVLAVVLLAPAAEAGGRNPGSVLVYTVQRSGPQFFTIVSVTNSSTVPMTPISFGGSTLVHFEYVNTIPNELDPQIPLGCTVFDRVEFLTPADTLSVVTRCHNAYAPQGQQGYLVVSAQDPSLFGVAWDHDYLMGSALIVNGSGGMYSVNAIPFDALVGSAMNTDVNANGLLDFDGVEYEEMPDVLYIDSFVALGGSSLALINFEGGPNARNTLDIRVWNDNEFPLSTTKVMGCWFDVPLTQVSPLFNDWYLGQNTPNDPSELDLDCDGVDDLETGWAKIDSINVSLPGGMTISSDGAVLGSITAGPSALIDGGHLLWEGTERNPFPGAFLEP